MSESISISPPTGSLFARLKKDANERVRVFALSVGAVLFFAAASKLANFPWQATKVVTAFDLNDPIFGISTKYLILAGVVLQLVAAVLCLFTKRTVNALCFVAWLAANFFIYRTGLWINGWHHPVSGLFYLSDDFGFSARTADIITLAASLYLFLGSLTALWVLRRRAEAARFLKACCPTCGGHVKFSIQNLGRQTDCPHCKTMMALRAPGETMKMSCGWCGGHVEFPIHALGQKISCPHCKKSMALLTPAALKTADDVHSGFTLIELLVVIAIIAILAALLLPVLSKAKDQGRQAVCRSNLHQIAIGFQLYGQESNDEFPAPGSKTEYGPQPEDWIWWEQDRDVNQSAIARHMAGFNPKVFTCPSDSQAQSLQGQGKLPDDPYRYSYSLTSYSLTGDNVNLGMSTIITKAREIYPFKLSQIRNPGTKIMLVEEDRQTINDSRWLPVANPGSPDAKFNLITSRHGKRGDVIFADTHIEAVRPEFGQDPTNSVPAY